MRILDFIKLLLFQVLSYSHDLMLVKTVLKEFITEIKVVEVNKTVF